MTTKKMSLMPEKDKVVGFGRSLPIWYGAHAFVKEGATAFFTWREHNANQRPEKCHYWIKEPYRAQHDADGELVAIEYPDFSELGLHKEDSGWDSVGTMQRPWSRCVAFLMCVEEMSLAEVVAMGGDKFRELSGISLGEFDAAARAETKKKDGALEREDIGIWVYHLEIVVGSGDLEFSAESWGQNNRRLLLDRHHDRQDAQRKSRGMRSRTRRRAPDPATIPTAEELARLEKQVELMERLKAAQA